MIEIPLRSRWLLLAGLAVTLALVAYATSDLPGSGVSVYLVVASTWAVFAFALRRVQLRLGVSEANDASLRERGRRADRQLERLDHDLQARTRLWAQQLAEERRERRASAPAAATAAPAGDGNGAEPGERVLIWRVPARFDINVMMERLLARGLLQLGAAVTTALCDQRLAGCLQRREDAKRPGADRGDTSEWAEQCAACFNARSIDLIRESGSRIRLLSEWVPEADLLAFREQIAGAGEAAITEWRHRDLPVGRYAVSSTIRYFIGADPTSHPRYLPVLREYLYSALVATEAAYRALEEIRPTRVVMNHGIYVEWGPAFDLARRRGIPVTRWHAGYRDDYWYVTTTEPHDNRHPHHMPDHAWRRRARTPLSTGERIRLHNYMTAQYERKNNRYMLFDAAPLSADAVRRELRLPADKPVWGVFCHLAWDSEYGFEEQTDGRTFRQWLIDTVATAVQVPEVHWLVKIHPAERYHRQEVGCRDFILQEFPDLPAHVQIIPADTEINTYGLLPVLAGVATIFGTAGMEAAMLGKPVIIAGQAHYGGKGFSYDNHTARDYTETLRAAPTLPPLTATQRELARRYAYDYLIARQLPLGLIALRDSDASWELPPELDWMVARICDTILSGGEFRLDEDEVGRFSDLAVDEVPALDGQLDGLDWAGLLAHPPEPGERAYPIPASRRDQEVRWQESRTSRTSTPSSSERTPAG